MATFAQKCLFSTNSKRTLAWSVLFLCGLPVGTRTQICRLGGDGVIPLRYGKRDDCYFSHNKADAVLLAKLLYSFVKQITMLL